MKKIAVAAIIPFLAGYLFAQPRQMKEHNLKTQTTTWKGTLVASGCRSSTGNRDSYPPAVLTTSFGLILEEGKCIPFDLNSNEKVAGIFKINTDWSDNVVKTAPTKVEVTGTENGGAISVDDIEFMKEPSPFPAETRNSPARK